MAQPNIVPMVMDLKSIPLAPQQAPPAISNISDADGFFLSKRRNDDFRIRTPIYSMLKEAQAFLPAGYYFMIVEAYRTKAVQERLWKETNIEMKALYPDISDLDLQLLCENFIANPYDGIGSGHQAACAIDVTLCDAQGNEHSMGAAMYENNEKTETGAQNIPDEAKQNRQILKNALEKAGFINYPAEWWHFSYGDHQWAFLTGKKEAIYGIIDI